MTSSTAKQTTHDQVSQAARPGLTREEDDELRRLNYLSHFGCLTVVMQRRFQELRARDRRQTVREPRDYETDEVAPEDLRRIIPPSERPA